MEKKKIKKKKIKKKKKEKIWIKKNKIIKK